MTIEDALLVFKNAGMNDKAIDKHKETLLRITNSPEEVACYAEFALKLHSGEVKNPLRSPDLFTLSVPRKYPWDTLH